MRTDYFKVNVQNKEVITNTMKLPIEERYVKVERNKDPKDLKNATITICEVINNGKEIHEIIFDWKKKEYTNRFDKIVEFKNYDLSDFKTAEIYQVPNFYEYGDQGDQYISFLRQSGGLYILFRNIYDLGLGKEKYLTQFAIDWYDKESEVIYFQEWKKYNKDGDLLIMNNSCKAYIIKEYDEDGNVIKNIDNYEDIYKYHGKKRL